MKTLDPLASQGVAALVAGVVVVASWQWGYESAAQASRRDSTRVASLSEQLGQIDAMVQAAGGNEAWRARHEQRLSMLTARFPHEEQLPLLLSQLLDTLKAGDLKVVNVEQGNLEAVQDAGQPVLIDGLPSKRLPVTVVAEGRYRMMVEALERLTGEAFPCVLGLEQIDLSLKETTGVEVVATLQFHLYVVGTLS